MNIVERIFYAVVRLLRWLFLIMFPVATLVDSAGWTWLPFVLVAVAPFVAIQYHLSNDPTGFFKGRLTTDVAVAGFVMLGSGLYPYLNPISLTLSNIGHFLGWGLAILFWLFMYRYEHGSVISAERIDGVSLMATRRFWGGVIWVFIILAILAYGFH